MRIPTILATLVLPTMVVPTMVFVSSCSLQLGEECVRESRVRTPFKDTARFLAIEEATFTALARQAPASLDLTPQTIVTNPTGEVVVVPVDPTDIAEISHLAHASTHRCGGFTAHTDLDSAIDRATELAAGSRRLASLDYSIDNAAVAQGLIDEATEPNIRATIEMLSSFRNRHHSTPTGAQASLWLRDFWLQLAGSRSDVTVEQIDHNSTPQKSVMMTITGATLPDEVVIFGAHLDSIAGQGGDSLAPGADDDASGVASITEVARTIFAKRLRPARTIKFIGYAAEEVGLRGSDEIAASFASQGVDVAAVMQLDMTNYNGSATDVTFIRDRTDDALTNFTAALIDTYLPGVSYTNGQCGYGCSDHASWDARGYPAVLPFEAAVNDSNPSIHTANDTLGVSQNSAAHALKFTRLAAAFAAEAAKGEFDVDMEPGDEPDPTPPDPNDDDDDDGADACL